MYLAAQHDLCADGRGCILQQCTDLWTPAPTLDRNPQTTPVNSIHAHGYCDDSLMNGQSCRMRRRVAKAASGPLYSILLMKAQLQYCIYSWMPSEFTSMPRLSLHTKDLHKFSLIMNAQLNKYPTFSRTFPLLLFHQFHLHLHPSGTQSWLPPLLPFSNTLVYSRVAI